MSAFRPLIPGSRAGRLLGLAWLSWAAALVVGFVNWPAAEDAPIDAPALITLAATIVLTGATAVFVRADWIELRRKEQGR
jgi:hypothetical protein